MLSFDSAGNEGFSSKISSPKNDTSSIPRTEAFEAVHSLEAKRWADSYIIGLLSENGSPTGIFCWDGKRSSYFINGSPS